MILIIKINENGAMKKMGKAPTNKHEYAIRTEDELRQLLAAPSDRLTAKIQPQLEATGRKWIEKSTLVGLATCRADGSIEVGLRAAGSSLASAPDNYQLEIRNQMDTRYGDEDQNLSENPFAGAIFMLPGENSTLRANGRARSTDEKLHLEVAETFMHCPKAFIRSGLWAGKSAPSPDSYPAEAGTSLGPSSRAFLATSPFLLIGTSLKDGGADISPRGDPAGFVHILDDHTLLIPDRPGNNIADTFRNLLANPQVGLLFLIPGVDCALQISGTAELTTDPEALEPMAVQEKIPKLAIRVHVQRIRLSRANALTTAGTWTIPTKRPEVPSLGRTLVDQVEPKGRFRALKGRLIDYGLRQDAKKNLY